MSRLRTFSALTRFNLRHMLSSPVFFLGVPLTLLFQGVTSYVPSAPTATDLYHQSSLNAMSVAAIMFVVTSFPALREVRHTADLALPLSARTRLLSLSLAAVTLASACTGSLIAGYLLIAPAPVSGVMSPFTLTGVLMSSWFGPLAAVTAAAWTRSFAPLVVFVMLIPAYLLYSFTATGSRADVIVSRMGWVVSSTMVPFQMPNPGVTLLGLLYLAYAALLAAALLCLATVPKSSGRGLRPGPLGVSLLLVVVITGTVVHGNRTYTYESDISFDQLHGAEAPSCRTRDGVAYCPLPGYESWVDYWHAALSPVLDRVPERERHRLLAVWQTGSGLRNDLYLEPPARSIIVGEYWETDQRYSADVMVADAATLLVGLPLFHRDAYPCSASGQSRLVVAAWLAAADEQRPREGRISTANSMLLDFAPAPQDLALAHALLDMPGERVGSVVDEHWDTVTSPGTGTGVLADLFGLPAPGGPGFPEPDWETSYWTEEEIGEWWEEPLPLCP